MRNRSGADDQEVLTQPKGGASIQDRIAAFAMLDGMKDATQAQKCLRLSLVGFTNAEIAAMLQTSYAVVATNLYNERKKSGKRPATRRGASPEQGAA